jgi:hypothetical protein
MTPLTDASTFGRKPVLEYLQSQGGELKLRDRLIGLPSSIFKFKF